MLIFLYPRILSRIASFPAASPYLGGKLENISYSNVSKYVLHGKEKTLQYAPNSFNNVSIISKLNEISQNSCFLAPIYFVSNFNIS